MTEREETEESTPQAGTNRLLDGCRRLVEANRFEYLIISIILFNAALLGLGTSPAIERDYGSWLNLANNAILGVFVVEALLKLAARWPRPLRYFTDGWNVFDFTVIVLALIPATGEFAIVTRLFRLLRVVRLISTIKDLRLIVAALVRSIPSVGHVLILMSIVVYIYAIMGYHLFHEHDPVHWRNLGISLLSLFRVLTLEDWTDIMYTAMEAYPWAWVYFVSFVVVGTFVVINMFIAIIINSLDDAKTERLRKLEGPPSSEELLREIRTTQATLRRLEQRMRDDERD
ncbi:MAG: ion transporter [Chloroflexota bacterium]|nr:ion transporter [Chloroflexota bacterium]MDE2940861.1 ion transporter [Chloroflexota bacterium]MDE3267549.1 ion transporter [Chloroflexota bacterium]